MMDTIKVLVDTVIAKVQELSPVSNSGTSESISMCTFLFVILLPLILGFVFLVWYYYRRKKKYYHDLTRKTQPRHIGIQLGMALYMLLCFFVVCTYLALYTPSDYFKWFAVVGVLLTWIFQDVVKNVVAYVVLILNGMLHLGDWIVLGKYDLDGKVRDMSLTTVIVENWDGSLTSISTKTLLDTNMQNLQNVITKKTSGRRMLRNFLIDVHSVQYLTSEQLMSLKETICKLDGDDSVIDYAIVNGEKQNLRIYRLYLRHWLMSQDTVTRSPKLAIRLLDQTPQGLQLQVYAFLLPTNWEEFEQEQARIVEHILETIELFGLVLFQSQAGTDTNNVNLTKGGIV